MRPEELQDIRVQDRLRRELAIKLGWAVIDAVNKGLSPEQAKKAVEEIWQIEVMCERTRQAFARTY
jgi:hypothetical protein